MKKQFVLIFWLFLAILMQNTVPVKNQYERKYSDVMASSTYENISSNVDISKIQRSYTDIKIEGGDIIAENISNLYFAGRNPHNFSDILIQNNLSMVTLFDIESLKGERFIYYATLVNVSSSPEYERNFTFAVIKINYTADIDRLSAIPSSIELLDTYKIVGYTAYPTLSSMDTTILDNGSLIVVFDISYPYYEASAGEILKNTTVFIYMVSNLSAPEWKLVGKVGWFKGYVTDIYCGSVNNTYYIVYGKAKYTVSGSSVSLKYSLEYKDNNYAYNTSLGSKLFPKTVGNFIYFPDNSLVGGVIIRDFYKQDEILTLVKISGPEDNRSLEMDADGFLDSGLLEYVLGYKPELKYPQISWFNIANICWYYFVSYYDTEQKLYIATVNFTDMSDIQIVRKNNEDELYDYNIANPSMVIAIDNDTEDNMTNALFLEYSHGIPYVTHMLIERVNGSTVSYGPEDISLNDFVISTYAAASNSFCDIVLLFMSKDNDSRYFYTSIVYYDSDCDGLGDWEETYRYGLDKNNSDLDNDYINDGAEVISYYTDPKNNDSDSDGLDDKFEIEVRLGKTYDQYGNITNKYSTDPLNNDSDYDGITDYMEITADYFAHSTPGYYTNPLSNDTDDDELGDWKEIFEGTIYWVNSTSNNYTAYSDPNNNDSDSDGLSDSFENTKNMDPASSDTDNDSVEDYFEIYKYNTSPNVFDTDNDGLSDGFEIYRNMNPLSNDTDGDMFNDFSEIALGSDPLDPDTDDDRLLDGEEFGYGTDILNNDTDNDNISDYDEIKVFETNPLLNDTDGDNISDNMEIYGVYISGIGKVKTDPLDPDTDDDGLSDYEEIIGTYIPNVGYRYSDPTSNDTDYDGLSDYEEIVIESTDPKAKDTDGDGLFDGEEVNYFNTSPIDQDTDNDGLSDYDETYGIDIEGIGIVRTDPLNGDSDNDNIGDYDECNVYLTNPLKNDSDDDGISDYEELSGWNISVTFLGSEGEYTISYFVNSSPRFFDTDDDGLNDLLEYMSGSDPRSSDTDNDGLSDLKEYDIGSSIVDPDTDNDGLSDYDEVNGISLEKYGTVRTDPLVEDTDMDNLTDYEEVMNYGSNPIDVDSDGDGLTDWGEVMLYSTDPAAKDTDQDYISDYDEVIKYYTNPVKSDSDGDKIIDGSEVLGFLIQNIGVRQTDPLSNDSDGDGLSDYEEGYIFFTDPTVFDTDGDGLSDKQEIDLESDPLFQDFDDDGLSDYEEVLVYYTDSFDNDSDGDGLSDYDEVKIFATDPLSNDSDGDGLSDYDEVNGVYVEEFDVVFRLDPNSNDTDNDGLLDKAEIYGIYIKKIGIVKTNPLSRDSDGDGIGDYDEAIIYHTSPTKADTDGDGLSDYDELRNRGTNPLLTDTDNDIIPDKFDIILPTAPDYSVIIIILVVFGIYKAYSYGLFRDWKGDIVALGVSDLGGVLMFVEPEEFQEKYDASLISSGLIGMHTMISELSQKEMEQLVLSGEIAIYLDKGKNTMIWVFLKKEYPRLIKKINSIHRELEDNYGVLLESWAGFYDEVKEAKYWLASRIGIKIKETKSDKIQRMIDELSE